MASALRPLPPDARRSLRVYNLFFPLVFLCLLPSFLLRMFRRGGFRAKFGQRLARYDETDLTRFRSREWLWVHSISVGETLVALKLARVLHERAPQFGILLSTTTSTGFAEALKSASDWLQPIYNPVDARSIVQRALDVLQPKQVALIEGEAWPNLVAECFQRGIPISLVNARLSPRSERRFRKFRRWTGPTFRMLTHVCVPEAADQERWQSLGVDAANIVTTGSIKFDQAVARSTREQEFRELLLPLGVPLDAPILVGGSTWDPEERVLTEMLSALRQKHPALFLILVPRHVERSAEILRQLAPLGLRIVRRSELPIAVPRPADVLLVDATGELRDWYALATVAFVGKSLPGVAEVGGQNPAEPALLGKPVLYGPHMENFASVVAHFAAANAAVPVSDAADLREALLTLLDSPERRTDLGRRAAEVLIPHTGATMRAAEALLSRS